MLTKEEIADLAKEPTEVRKYALNHISTLQDGLLSIPVKADDAFYICGIFKQKFIIKFGNCVTFDLLRPKYFSNDVLSAFIVFSIVGLKPIPDSFIKKIDQ